MKIKTLLLTFISFIACTLYGQENVSLFSRLQGISNRGVDFFNVDGIEITSQKLMPYFPQKIACENFHS